jgi:hypothetical protein
VEFGQCQQSLEGQPNHFTTKHGIDHPLGVDAKTPWTCGKCVITVGSVSPCAGLLRWGPWPMMGASDNATLEAVPLTASIQPRSGPMSAYEASVIALFVVTFALVRFGVPLLVMWAVRQIAVRVAPNQT